MVSLGPVAATRHCSFRCPFCYVREPAFVRYKSWPVEADLEWVRTNLSQINVIYVSGDTDSFAPPRTGAGLSLLGALADLGRDLLFTTRHVFVRSEEWHELKGIAERVRSVGRNPIACVSVCQLSRPDLEPRPIAQPAVRIEQLGKLNAVGWTSVLAMRPIMPAFQLRTLSESFGLQYAT